MKILQDNLGRTNAPYILMGGRPHQPAIKAYTAEIGVDDICQFTSRILDEGLCEVPLTAGVGANPDPLTPWSNQSTTNKIMKYMSFELPNDLKEAQVSVTKAAIYVNANDERSLATAIMQLLDSPDNRRKMGAIGQAIEQLSWNTLSHTCLRPIKRCLGRPPEPHLLVAYQALLGSTARI